MFLNTRQNYTSHGLGWLVNRARWLSLNSESPNSEHSRCHRAKIQLWMRAVCSLEMPAKVRLVPCLLTRASDRHSSRQLHALELALLPWVVLTSSLHSTWSGNRKSAGDLGAGLRILLPETVPGELVLGFPRGGFAELYVVLGTVILATLHVRSVL